MRRLVKIQAPRTVAVLVLINRKGGCARRRGELQRPRKSIEAAGARRVHLRARVAGRLIEAEHGRRIGGYQSRRGVLEDDIARADRARAAGVREEIQRIRGRSRRTHEKRGQLGREREVIIRERKSDIIDRAEQPRNEDIRRIRAGRADIVRQRRAGRNRDRAGVAVGDRDTVHRHRIRDVVHALNHVAEAVVVDRACVVVSGRDVVIALRKRTGGEARDPVYHSHRSRRAARDLHAVLGERHRARRDQRVVNGVSDSGREGDRIAGLGGIQPGSDGCGGGGPGIRGDVQTPSLSERRTRTASAVIEDIEQPVPVCGGSAEGLLQRERSARLRDRETPGDSGRRTRRRRKECIRIRV